jgi:predicted nucleic acid-binding protein
MLVFFDTNIIVYAEDAADPKKQQRAAQCIAEHFRRGEAVVSTQVLQEYFNACTKKLGLNAEFVSERMQFLAQMQVVNATPAIIFEAIEIHRIHKISFWDALIVQTAKLSGCDVLYTEGMNNLQMIAGVKLVNPFAAQ